MVDYTLYCFTHRTTYLEELRDIKVDYTLFPGVGFSSFSEIINNITAQCPTEYVLFMNDKSRPNQSHVYNTLSLLEKGFGMVALDEFYFWGWSKELLRRVGMMDENFVGGGYEDVDMVLRIQEANIGLYTNNIVPRVKAPSSWKYKIPRSYFLQKWSYAKLIRKLPEPTYDYDLGPSTNKQFLPFVRRGPTINELEQPVPGAEHIVVSNMRFPHIRGKVLRKYLKRSHLPRFQS